MAAYSPQNAVADVVGILDALSVASATLLLTTGEPLWNGERGNAVRQWLMSALDLGSVSAKCFESIAERITREPRSALAGVASKPPPVKAPTLGIWPSNDHYLDGERMKVSDAS